MVRCLNKLSKRLKETTGYFGHGRKCTKEVVGYNIRPHEINCVFGVSCGSNDGSGGRVIIFFTARGPVATESIVHKNMFLTICVSLSELGPPETHENLSVKRLCGSSNEKQGEKLLLSWRHWAPLVQPLSRLAKNRHVGTVKTSQPQSRPTDDWRTMDRAIPQGLQRPWEKFGSAQLSVEKQKGKLPG